MVLQGPLTDCQAAEAQVALRVSTHWPWAAPRQSVKSRVEQSEFEVLRQKPPGRASPLPPLSEGLWCAPPDADVSGTCQTLPHSLRVDGYVFPFVFYVCCFCCCFGISEAPRRTCILDSLNVPLWLPLKLRQPLFKWMEYLFVKTRCHLLEIKYKI